MAMSAEGLQDALAHLLDDHLTPHTANGGEQAEIESVETFREAELLTHDHGLVVRVSDGTEFQITIVQSGGPRADDDGGDDD